MGAKSRVWHIIRDSKKTLCACYWYPGDKVLTEAEVNQVLGQGVQWCKTCAKRMAFRIKRALQMQEDSRENK